MAERRTAEAPNQHKNEKVGEVVSTKMQKTIVVQVSRRVPHPLYKRIVTKHKKFYAHDEENTARVGDVVRIVECRPHEQAEAVAPGRSDPALGTGSVHGAAGRSRRQRFRL